jgi:hypothetical protein
MSGRLMCEEAALPSTASFVFWACVGGACGDPQAMARSNRTKRAKTPDLPARTANILPTAQPSLSFHLREKFITDTPGRANEFSEQCQTGFIPLHSIFPVATSAS